MAISWRGLQFCCFRFPLKTGVKFFGFFSICGCLLNALLSLWELVVVERCMSEEPECGGSVEDGVYVIAVLSVDILLQVIFCTTSVLLLLAVYQHNQKLVLPWLVTTVVCAIAEIVFLPSFLGRMFGSNHQQFIFTLRWFMFIAFQMFDDLYGWLVVYSYYMSPAAPCTNLV